MGDMGEKIYGYMRVSTREQNEDRQRVALLAAGVPERNLFMDKLSGKDFERPEYKKMIKRLKPGDTVFVKSIDRLGRNYADLREQWGIITKEKLADVCVIDMPILDTRREKSLVGTLISDLVLSLLSFVAENERDEIRRRQAEGIEAAKSRGVRFGRPARENPASFEEACYGWKKGEMTTEEAARQCGLPKSTFYDKAKLAVGKKGEKQKNE